MPSGLSVEEVEWLREGYRLFREGDPGFLERYAPEAQFSFPETLPAGGTYTNLVDALEFFTTAGELFEDPYPEPDEFLRVGDRLTVLGTWRGRSRNSGDELTVRFAHILRYPDGDATLIGQQAVSFELFLDTAAILRSIGVVDESGEGRTGAGPSE